VLQRAAKAKTQISRDVRYEAAGTLIEVALHQPGIANSAWQTFMELLAYVTSVNNAEIPHPENTKIPKGSTTSLTAPGLFPNQPMGDKILYAGTARPESAAIMEKLDQPVKTIGGGPSYWIIHDAPVALDGYHLKNVIFVRSRVVYSGGPLRLEAVYFSQCTFEFQKSISPADLGKTLVAKDGAGVTFSAPTTTFGVFTGLLSNQQFRLFLLPIL
jgi:hypothetical protein